MFPGGNMKFFVIGQGFVFPRHKEAIKSIGGEIVDAIDKEDGEEKWKEVLNNTSADYVSVLAPNFLHYEMIKKSLEKGKTVLCEKPLVINSEDIKGLIGKKVFSVLQLRYHPLVKKIKEGISKEKDYKIDMDISVYRDSDYYQGWKGDKKKSGGVLFNLGIHYFDLLLYLFSEEKEVKTSFLNSKTGEGVIKGENYICNWRISTDEKRNNQRRIFKINGKDYNFSSQDNLSYENLHKFIYEDLIKRKGVRPEEEIKSIRLVEKLYGK